MFVGQWGKESPQALCKKIGTAYERFDNEEIDFAMLQEILAELDSVRAALQESNDLHRMHLLVTGGYGGPPLEPWFKDQYTEEYDRTCLQYADEVLGRAVERDPGNAELREAYENTNKQARAYRHRLAEENRTETLRKIAEITPEIDKLRGEILNHLDVEQVARRSIEMKMPKMQALRREVDIIRDEIAIHQHLSNLAHQARDLKKPTMQSLERELHGLKRTLADLDAAIAEKDHGDHEQGGSGEAPAETRAGGV